MKILCSVLFISAFGFFDGARAINWRCHKRGIIEHGRHAQIGKYRTYQCDAGYVSNIPDLTKIKFKCGGDIKWKAIGVKMVLNNENLYSDNITCHRKVVCSEPPSRSHVKSDVVQYQLEVRSNMMTIRRPQYFSGDKIKYSCANGYEDVVSYDYSDYGSEYTTENDTVSEITCDNSGLWNGMQVDELSVMECTVIQCDAREYMNMSNGIVTNYKGTFGYLDAMQLSCDEGFRSKGEINSLTCLFSDSFTLSEFGCEPITCIPPVNPVNGWVDSEGNRVGDKANFYCNLGANLTGQNEWTCQSDGSWDWDCVTCHDEQSYCDPPCIPLGAEMISTDNAFYVSSTVEFICSGGQDLVKSTKRTCLSNRTWSGQPIDCTGESRYDPFVGSAILSAMERIADKTKTTDAPRLQGRMINVGDAFGVDVYFLIDVSKSIDEDKLKLRQLFMNALLPKLGINDTPRGTRLAFYYFASETYIATNQHYFESADLFKNYKEAQDYIANGVNLTQIRLKTKLGTAITTGLNDVAIDIRSKQKSKVITRKAQQVVIVISDGQYNTNGDPTEVATKLKQEPYSAEIYSILIGSHDAQYDNFYQAMKKMASDIKNEEHFFAIRNEENLLNIVYAMIADDPNLVCGRTEPFLTNLPDDHIPKIEHQAKKGAWPWMAQLLSANKIHICGGSLIDTQWILTAAHCLSGTAQVLLKKLKTGDRHNAFEYEINLDDKFQYPKYNESVKPIFLYDIGLIKLREEIVRERELLEVCLPDSNDLEDKFEEGVFGVVTGWGESKIDGKVADSLKQMQMSIKDCSAENATVFDPKTMFCAGDIDGDKIVDASKGDSGGPFSVRKENDKNRFEQIGIVSFGIECKKPCTHGFYTKLTAEVLEWIKNVQRDN